MNAPLAIRLVSAGFLFLIVGSCSRPNYETFRTPLLTVPEPMIEPDPIAAGKAPPPGAYAPRIDILHYELELAFSDTLPSFLGRAGILLRLLDAELDEVSLDLTGLIVEEVSIRRTNSPTRKVDVGRDAAALLEGGKLRIGIPPSPSEASFGDSVEISVQYRGVPDDGLIIGENLHGDRTIFADNWPNRARFWFPSVDHPSDKATVSFTVHVPADWNVVANGHMAGFPQRSGPEALGGGWGKRSWRWETGVPIPTYTMVVGAGTMRTGTIGKAACGSAPLSPRRDGCIEVTYWAFPPDEGQARKIFARAAEMVDYYTQVIGPFPYEKLANVQSSTRFGGMENAAAIFYPERAISEGTLSEGTVAHEIAHQWFGDSVTEGEWSHLWLSEGFATYFGALFFEHAEGPDSLRSIMSNRREALLASNVADRPIVAREENLFDLLNSNNYAKGGWVLHMLRGVVGDTAFFQGIPLYYLGFQHHNALTGDLQDAMQDATGRDLSWFFDQWLFQPGHPIFEATWAWDEKSKVAELLLRQIQSDQWPVFRTPLTIDFQLSDGTSRTVVEVTDREQSFRIPLESAPTGMILDADVQVLMKVVVPNEPESNGK